VNKGTNVDSPDRLGWVSVHTAAFYANTEVLKCIAATSSKRLAVTSKFSKSTPLHRVLQNQDTKEQDKYMCVKLLLSSLNPPEITALINRRDYYYGFTPWNIATILAIKKS